MSEMTDPTLLQRLGLRLLRLLLLLLPGAILILFWQWASGRLIATLYVSKPTDIAVRFYEMFASGEIQPHIMLTAQALVPGYCIGVGVGDRKSVVVGTRVYERVVLGGRRIIKKQKTTKNK